MVTKVSACIYLDRKVLEAAKKVGLNVSRVSENVLVEAIGRLGGSERETGLRSGARAVLLLPINITCVLFIFSLYYWFITLLISQQNENSNGLCRER